MANGGPGSDNGRSKASSNEVSVHSEIEER